MKELTILLVFCNLIIFTYSGPDPEINLHVHLPPEEGTSLYGLCEYFFKFILPSENS